eukprot:snap_masked-scaffold_3-processed-gene-19.26-mRNA-1 protein AED:0.11 eAED:0.18 QI:0/-1/0/1/-1/1/1/0/237
MRQISKIQKPLRSVLYMPASNSKVIQKSLTSLNADAYIYDLEDSVSPEESLKQQARANALEALNTSTSGQKIIRLNSTSSSFYSDDILSLKNHLSNGNKPPDALLLAKTETKEQLLSLQSEFSLPLWCMIETPKSILNIEDIIQVQNLSCIVLGLEDLSSELNLIKQKGRSNLQYAMQKVLITSKAFESSERPISVLDGVYTNLKDDEGFKQECQEAKEMGFSGKTLIHPKTITMAK